MKRLSTVIAVVSMINMATFAGVVTLAWSKGWLEPDRLRRAFAVLQGNEPDPESPPPSADARAPSGEAEAVAAERKTADEVARTELDRRRREIQNAWDLLERQQLAFVQAKENFEARQRRYQEELDRRSREAGDSGFAKELEILSELKPKDAKEILRLKDEADVVRILMTIEPRKARKIVGECRKNDERLWIGRILEKMHGRDATQAEVLAAGN